MLRNKLVATAALIVGMALPAQANNFFVILVPDGFFPEISYVQPGDVVTFVNDDEVSHLAGAPDDSWTTGTLEAGDQHSITITSEITLTYVVDAYETVGSFSFDPAPIDPTLGGAFPFDPVSGD
jgi:plastocyanin